MPTAAFNIRCLQPRRAAFARGVLVAGLLMWVGLCCTVPARAQSEGASATDPPPATGSATSPAAGPAATAPATLPATSPVYTQATPKEALKYFAAALRDGDADRLRKAVLTANEAEEGMVLAIADMADALTRLYQAAAQAFGPEAARRFTDDTSAGFYQTVTRIDAADVAVEADTAVVRYADAKDNPYTLKRVGDDWKVPATQFTQGAEAETLKRRVGELGSQARIVREMGKEIADGKHKSAEAAGLAWRSKMMAALSGEGPKSKPKSETPPTGETPSATKPAGAN